MKFYIAVVRFLTEVPVLSQAFLRSASTQYRRVPAHFKPCSKCSVCPLSLLRHLLLL